MKLIRCVQSEYQLLRTEQAQWMTQAANQMRMMEENQLRKMEEMGEDMMSGLKVIHKNILSLA